MSRVNGHDFSAQGLGVQRFNAHQSHQELSSLGPTEAQQALLKKFPQLEPDDPIVEMAAWNAVLEQRLDQFGGSIDLWTTAILKQAEASQQQALLFVNQSSTLQEIGQSNAMFSRALLMFNSSLERQEQTLASQNAWLSRFNGSLQDLSRVAVQNQAALERLQRFQENTELGVRSLNSKPTLQWMIPVLIVNTLLVAALAIVAFAQLRPF